MFSSEKLFSLSNAEVGLGGGGGGCSERASVKTLSAGNSSRPALLSSRQRLVQTAAFMKTLAYVSVLKRWLVSLSSSCPFVVASGGAVGGGNDHTEPDYYFFLISFQKQT